jgi:CxxC motif-containing protein
MAKRRRKPSPTRKKIVDLMKMENELRITAPVKRTHITVKSPDNIRGNLYTVSNLPPLSLGIAP